MPQQGLIKSARSTGYKPQIHKLDEQKETVAGRIHSLVGQDSPLLQQARTRARQASNRRGLLNSSMAVGAGREAVLNTALPIAQQDAASSLNVSQTNQGFINRAREFGAGAENQFGLQELSGEQARGLQELVGEQQIGLQGLRGTQESQLLEQRGQIEKELQGADAATRERLLEQQGQIDQQLQELRGQQTISQQELVGQQEQQLVAQRGEIQQQLQSADAATRERLLAQQAEIDQQLQQLRGTQATELQELSGAQAMEQQRSQQVHQKALAEIDRTLQTTLQQMRGDQAKELTGLENKFKAQLQASQSSAMFFSQTATSIGDILAQPDIGVDEKQQLVEKQLQLLENGMTVIGQIGDLDLAGLLDFAAPTPSQVENLQQQINQIEGGGGRFLGYDYNGAPIFG